MTEPTELKAQAEALLKALPGKVDCEVMLNWPCEEQVSLVWWDTPIEQIERENLHHLDGLDFRVIADLGDHDITHPFWKLAEQAIPLARQGVELAEEVERLRAGMQALQDWAVRERDEAWATEKVAVEQGIIPGPLDWPHRKGAALLNVVGRISQILKPTQEAQNE